MHDDLYVPSSTPNFQTELANQLAEFAPEIISDGKIDINKLTELLELDSTGGGGTSERFGLTWPGKREAQRLAQTPTTATLKPDRKNSKNWDTTNNVFIEGDNLEVLKILQRHYYGKIKMIYIDPPYNTGKDFVYKDNFRDGVANYLEWTNQVNEHGKTTSNAETSGRFHSNWLNMMYPRLKLARNLLTEDGFVFISIDENEYPQIRCICNEIFGEINYRNTIIVRRRVKSLNSQYAESGLQSLNIGAEYVLVYARSNLAYFNPIRVKKDKAPTKGKWDVFWSNADRPTMRYELLGFTPKTGQWRNSKDVALAAVENYKTFLLDSRETGESIEQYSERTGIKKFIRRQEGGTGKNGGVQHWVAPEATMLRSSLWKDIEVSEISKEFEIAFDNPKSKNLLLELVRMANLEDRDIVLDFFAGSGTTAHALMLYNIEAKKSCRTISVQLPEPIEQENGKFEQLTVADLGRKRLVCAGEKIINSTKNTLQFEIDSVDIGFRSYRLSDTNFLKWKLMADIEEDDLLEELSRQRNSLDGEVLQEDLFVEALLKLGFSLTENYTKEIVHGLEVFSVEEGLVIAYFNEQVKPTLEQLWALIEATEVRLIILEDAFGGNDSNKTNLVQMCKTRGVELTIV